MAKGLGRYKINEAKFIWLAFYKRFSVYVKQKDTNNEFQGILIKTKDELIFALKMGFIIMNETEKIELDSQYPNRFKCWKDGIKFKIHN